MSQTGQVSLKYNKDIFNNISKKEMLMTNNELTPMDEFVITIIGSHGSVKGNTRLQKYAFLADQNKLMIPENLELNFEPHNFGPYSKLIPKSIAKLIEGKFVEECHVPNGPSDIIGYTLTKPKGEYRFRKLQDKTYEDEVKFIEMTQRFQNKTLGYLLKFVYENYPKFTINSQIKKEVLDSVY